MELEPRVIFSIIVGVPLVLILGMGVTTAALFYLLDRAHRRALAEAEQARMEEQERRESAPRPTPAFGAQRGGAAVQPPLSPISRMVTAEGYVEVAPSLGVPSSKLGMWVFLASEVMFFTALIAAYLAFRSRGLLDPGDVLNIPLTALNTFILIVSSFTVVMALDSIEVGNQNRFVLMLLATLALGSTFITIQGVEWNELLRHGITPGGNLLGTAFFVLTGFHGLHVIVGLLALIFLLLRAFRGDFTPERHLGVEMFGLYWHFVDIVWIVLFTIIYLI